MPSLRLCRAHRCSQYLTHEESGLCTWHFAMEFSGEPHGVRMKEPAPKPEVPSRFDREDPL
jgi:hypothetical protein